MTPQVALWAQGAWIVVLLISGSFELVTSMYVWVNWLFYLLMVIAVFECRRRGMARAFTIKGYPWIPAVFLIFTVLYHGLTLRQDILDYQSGVSKTINSLMGLALVVSALPLYIFMKYVGRNGSEFGDPSTTKP